MFADSFGSGFSSVHSPVFSAVVVRHNFTQREDREILVIFEQEINLAISRWS